jgi:UDP-N-acetylglucosamine:LPS N-acetylglucosamine transferase
MVGRFAAACAVSFPDTDLPRSVLTGNPVRPEMLAVDRADRARARAQLGIPAGTHLVVVTGGSLGALRINEAVVAALGPLSRRGDLVVHHVIGARDWETIAPAARERAAGLDYRPVRYEHDMATVFTAADLVVSRAGASTTAELAVVGLPSVLVPLPGAPGDHQTANAQALVRAGGAVLVPDVECTGDRLVAEIDAVLARLDTMGEAAATVGRRDAAERVAALLEEHAR